MAADPQMAAAAERAREAGYRHIQIKVGGDPRRDIERIRAPAALLHTTDLHNYHAEHHGGGGPGAADGRMVVPTGQGLGVSPGPDTLGEPAWRFRHDAGRH